MPTFAEYETYGEPLVVSDERRHVVTVWQARRSGGDPRLYVVKCYAPRVSQSLHGQETEALAKDQGLEFLEGIKQIKRALSEGARNLAPIHALGKTESEAWYVTDHYPRNNLKAWVSRRGGVDSDALRHVVQSVVAGCLALKRSRGYSHGNLKPSNVFLVGQPRPLKKTPLVLTDAYPAAPLQLAALGPGDRKEAGQLLTQVMGAQDLRNIGELILQLVEGRLFARCDDYNYPVARSGIWDILGKDADYWLKLCNQLVNPQLSLETINLESLARKFPSRTAGLQGLIKGVSQKPASLARQFLSLTAGVPQLIKGAGQNLAKAGKPVAAIAAVALVGLGVYLGWGHIRKSGQEHQAALSEWSNKQTKGLGLIEQTNFEDAGNAFSNAITALGKWTDKEQAKVTETQANRDMAAALAQAKALLEQNRPSDALEKLNRATSRVAQFTNAAQWVALQALLQATNTAKQSLWDESGRWIGLASLVAPADPRPKATQAWIEGERNVKLRDERWREVSTHSSFSDSRSKWSTYRADAAFTNLLYRSFLQAFTSVDSFAKLQQDLQSQKYDPPAILANLSTIDRSNEIAALTHIAAADGQDKRAYETWAGDLNRNYGQLEPRAFADGWTTNIANLESQINQIASRIGSQTKCPTNALGADLNELHSLQENATTIANLGQRTGANRLNLRTRAAEALATYRRLLPSVTSHLDDYDNCKAQTGHPWFTRTVKQQLQEIKNLKDDSELTALCAALPEYAAGGLVRTAKPLSDFEDGLSRWWERPAYDAAAMAALPSTNTLSVALKNAETKFSTPAYASDASLVASVQARVNYRLASVSALRAVSNAWNTVSGANLSAATAAWQVYPLGEKNFIQRIVQLDFERGVGTNVATLVDFTKAASKIAADLKARLDQNYYSPPDILTSLEDIDKKEELSSLSKVLQGKGEYGNWVDALKKNYGAVINLSLLITNWPTLDVAGLRRELNGISGDMQSLSSPFKPNPSIETLNGDLGEITQAATDLEQKCQKAGVKHARLVTDGESTLAKAGTLRSNLAKIRSSFGNYRSALTSFDLGHYSDAIRTCRAYGYDDLLKAINEEQNVYSTAQENLSNCLYNAVTNLTGSFINKECFRKVIQDAKAEASSLNHLRGLTNQISNRRQVLDELATLNPSSKGKACFQDIAKWIRDTDPCASWENMLNVYEVNLGVRTGADTAGIIDPYTHRPAQKLPSGNIDEDEWNAKVVRLRQNLQDCPTNAKETRLKKLETKIKLWNR